MKIVKKVVNYKKKVFAVRMNLDSNTDDVWNVYNLLSVGDLVTGTCHRKIQKELNGLTKIEKKTITCTLQVKSFIYDTETDTLRISGVNATENKWIGMGVQQSMDIQPPRQITIQKRIFDSMHVRRLDQIIKEQEQGHLVAITMEEGIAHIFLVSQHKTVLKAKVEKAIAKNAKGGVGSKSNQSKSKFFDLVIKLIEQNFSGENIAAYQKVNCVVVGSPGFVMENFYNHLKEIVQRGSSDFLKDFYSKTITAHCSSGFKHSLSELLSSQNLASRIQSMSCASETAILDKYFETLALCQDKVTYGPKSVQCAMENMAVETLLISDKLFRAKNIEQRKYYVKLHDQAQHNGINVVIFGSMSPSGQRLNNLTGIAAILRFELPQLDEMVEADDGDLDSDDDLAIGSENTGEESKIDDQADEIEEQKSGSKSSHASELESAFMDDVFNQLGGFDVGDYDDEEDIEDLNPPTSKKFKSSN